MPKSPPVPKTSSLSDDHDATAGSLVKIPPSESYSLCQPKDGSYAKWYMAASWPIPNISRRSADHEVTARLLVKIPPWFSQLLCQTLPSHCSSGVSSKPGKIILNSTYRLMIHASIVRSDSKNIKPLGTPSVDRKRSTKCLVVQSAPIIFPSDAVPGIVHHSAGTSIQAKNVQAIGGPRDQRWCFSGEGPTKRVPSRLPAACTP